MHDFLECYSVGALLAYHGINEGIENTNYFVDTTKGQFVLTIFEQQSSDNLPYFLKLMAYISDANLPVPTPVPDKQRNYLQELRGKPSVLITRLSGQTIRTATVEQCYMLGRMLATVHLTASNFKHQRANQRGLAWCRDINARVRSCLNLEDADLLDRELRHHNDYPLTDIPAGTIHADLFRDNVLFEHGRLTGLIDFYYACNDKFIYDIAITVNDWCVKPDGRFDLKKYHAFIAAYQQLRTFNKNEQLQWQNALRHAALRFWLSRLYDKHFPRRGHITHTKDPNFIKNILYQRIREAPSLCQNQ